MTVLYFPVLGVVYEGKTYYVQMKHKYIYFLNVEIK